MISKLTKFMVVIMLIPIISGLIIIFTMQNTILNKEYVVGMLEDSNYFDNIYSLCNSNFRKYIYQSGLPEVILNDIVSVGQIKEDTNILLTNVYEGKNNSISTQYVSKKIFYNIENNIEEDYADLDEATKDNIDKFVETLVNEYSKTLIDYGKSEEIGAWISKISSVVTSCITMLVIFVVIGLVLIAVSSIGEMYTCFRALTIVSMSSGLINLVIHFGKDRLINIENIILFNDAVTIFGRNVIKDISNQILVYGTVLLTVGIISSMALAVIKNRRENEDGKS